MAEALATPEQYAALIGEPPRDALALAAASDAVRGYCGWDISAGDYVAELGGTPGPVLRLPSLHVTAVASVVVDGELLDADAYEWHSSGLLRRAGGWPQRWRSVEVVYSGGYDPVPDLVVAVVCEHAARMAVPVGVSSVSVGGITTSFSRDTATAALGTVARAALDRYRIPGSQ